MSQFEQHIQDGKDLYEWFHMVNNRREAIAILQSGIFVSTYVRNQVLLSVDSGKIALDGKVHQIEFENMQGDIWRAFIRTGE